jgi:hypothetical protein
MAVSTGRRNALDEGGWDDDGEEAVGAIRVDMKQSAASAAMSDQRRLIP